jgi:hypothetical protein
MALPEVMDAQRDLPVQPPGGGGRETDSQR